MKYLSQWGIMRMISIRHVTIILWSVIFFISIEALFFGNGQTLMIGLALALLGIFLETKEKAWYQGYCFQWHSPQVVWDWFLYQYHLSWLLWLSRPWLDRSAQENEHGIQEHTKRWTLGLYQMAYRTGVATHTGQVLKRRIYWRTLSPMIMAPLAIMAVPFMVCYMFIRHPRRYIRSWRTSRRLY